MPSLAVGSVYLDRLSSELAISKNCFYDGKKIILLLFNAGRIIIVHYPSECRFSVVLDIVWIKF